MLKWLLSFFIAFLILIGLTFEVAIAETSKEVYLSYEQRVIMSYALHAYKLPVLERATVFQKMMMWWQNYKAQPVTEKRVDSFDQFLMEYRGQWPNSGDLAEDLRIIEKSSQMTKQTYKANNSELQNKINSFLINNQVEALNLLLQHVDETQTFTKFDLNKMDKVNISYNQWELPIKQLMDVYDYLITTQILTLDHVGSQIAQQRLQINNDPMMQIFISTLFNEYFKRLSLDVKKNIVADLLGKNLNLSDLEKLEVLIQNSGPQFQKILQIVARQGGIDSELMEVLKKLEDAVRSVPYYQVKEILNSERRNYAFMSVEEKPLGVGTMAQVHKGVLIDYKGNKRNVVIRFIKPNIEKRINQDQQILTEVANILDDNLEFKKSGAPKLSPIIEDLTNTVKSELELSQTIQNQSVARRVYTRVIQIKIGPEKYEIEFKVPELYQAPGRTLLMVQELVKGKKLELLNLDKSDQTAEIKQAIIENLVRLWLQEAIFGSGFYHSDLHQGNMLAYKVDNKIQVSLLDYGMGGVLSRQLQDEILMVGAGIILKKPELLAEALWNISEKSKNQISQEEFYNKIKEQMRIKNLSPEMWTAWATDLGIKFPYEFINLNRGIVILTKLLQNTTSSLTLTEVMKQLSAQHPFRMLNLLKNRGVTNSEIIRVGWNEFLNKTEPIKINNMNVLRCDSVFK